MRRLEHETLSHYTKIVEKMEQLNMTQDEQIEYLKSQLLYCEYKLRRKNTIERLLFLGVFFILISLYLISIKIYLIGFLCMLLPGIYISYKIISLAEQNNESIKENERKKLMTLLSSEEVEYYLPFSLYYQGV